MGKVLVSCRTLRLSGVVFESCAGLECLSQLPQINSIQLHNCKPQTAAIMRAIGSLTGKRNSHAPISNFCYQSYDLLTRILYSKGSSSSQSVYRALLWLRKQGLKECHWEAVISIIAFLNVINKGSTARRTRNCLWVSSLLRQCRAQLR